MGYALNQYPLILSVKTDGSLETTVRNTEQFLVGGARKAADAWEQAGKKADSAFGLENAKRAISGLIGPIDHVKTAFESAVAETVKMAAAAQGLGSRLSGALDISARDAQRAAEQSRLQAAALREIAKAAEQAAKSSNDSSEATRAWVAGSRAAATQAEQEAAKLKALATTRERLQVALDARGTSNPLQPARPQIDTRSNLSRFLDGSASIDRAAVSGVKLEQVLGRVNKQVAQFGQEARRAAIAAENQANAIRASAPSADTLTERLIAGRASLDRAAVSGTTLEQVLGRVADRSAGVTANTERARIATEQATIAAQKQADAIARQVAEAAKLVAGPQFVQTTPFNPQQMQAAAAAARVLANEQLALANAADVHARSSSSATEYDRALAATMRQTAQAADAEASRLEGAAAAQARLAASAQAAGVKLAQSNDVLTGSIRGQRFVTIQAAQQFQDFFIQIQGGQNALVAFTQQASQLSFVMAGAGGTAGKFANFIAGPWGTLILGGIAVAGIFAGKLFEESEASKKAAGAAKEHESAIKALNEAMERSVQTVEDKARADYIALEVERQKTVAIREQTQAMLEQAKLLAQNAEAKNVFAGGPGGAQSLVAAQYASKVVELEGQLAENQKALDRLSRNSVIARGNYIASITDKLRTPEGAANRRFDDERNTIIKRGGSNEEVARSLARVEAARAKELDRIRETEKALNRSATQRDPANATPSQVSKLLLEAFGGGTITSTTGGKHVKGSYHYKGQALDFVPTGGMGSVTKDQIREVAAAAAVRSITRHPRVMRIPPAQPRAPFDSQENPRLDPRQIGEGIRSPGSCSRLVR